VPAGVLALGGTAEVLELVARAVAPVLEVAGELLDVLAGAVATAVVGAGGTAAAAAFVAVEALALASLAVAEALVAAFSVVEVGHLRCRSVACLTWARGLWCPSPPVLSRPFVPFAGAGGSAARLGMPLAGGAFRPPVYLNSLSRTVAPY
jgi:hypothetical protein